MRIITPEYYHRFQCIAAACPDSCCKEWEVDVDPKAAAMYRQLPGELGDRLRSVLKDTEDSTIMTITDRRCPMWREDGLCEIQYQLGHDALCQTCRDFPRLRHDYGDFVELGLELSCPEAARLIFADGTLHTTAQQTEGGEEPDYETDIMEILLQSRQEMLTFLDQSNYTLPEAMAVLLLFGYSVQNCLDGGEAASLDAESCLLEARNYVEVGAIDGLFTFFSGLEILTSDWQQRIAAGPVNRTWNEALRPFLYYGIHRYWLQAVSDYDLICRVKWIIASCILINALGGDPVQTAQQFSKEIENDPDNMDTLLDAAYTALPFTDRNLLSILFTKNEKV